MRYKHIFFDLDRTLWDFEKSSFQTLTEIVEEYELIKLGVPSAEGFIAHYLEVNEALWALYRKNEIKKEDLRTRRFYRTLEHFGIKNDELAHSIGFYYIEQSPIKTNLFPHTIEMLKELKSDFKLHIITNGFEEVQHIKLESCAIHDYFEQIVTSEKTGCKKPDPAIFHGALKLANAKAEESLMVGDDIPVDLHGAMDVGIDAAYFNPNEEPAAERVTFEYKDHLELVEWLKS